LLKKKQKNELILNKINAHLKPKQAFKRMAIVYLVIGCLTSFPHELKYGDYERNAKTHSQHNKNATNVGQAQLVCRVLFLVVCVVALLIRIFAFLFPPFRVQFLQITFLLKLQDGI
jgi:hypothetical protein